MLALGACTGEPEGSESVEGTWEFDELQLGGVPESADVVVTAGGEMTIGEDGSMEGELEVEEFGTLGGEDYEMAFRMSVSGVFTERTGEFSGFVTSEFLSATYDGEEMGVDLEQPGPFEGDWSCVLDVDQLDCTVAEPSEEGTFHVLTFYTPED